MNRSQAIFCQGLSGTWCCISGSLVLSFLRFRHELQFAIRSVICAFMFGQYRMSHSLCLLYSIPQVAFMDSFKHFWSQLFWNSHFVIFDENFVSVIGFFFETPVWSCISKYFMFVVRPSLFGQLCNCLKGWICFCCFLKLFQFLHWNWKVGYQEMDLHFSFSIRYPLISVSGLQVGSG